MILVERLALMKSGPWKSDNERGWHQKSVGDVVCDPTDLLMPGLAYPVKDFIFESPGSCLDRLAMAEHEARLKYFMREPDRDRRFIGGGLD